MFFLFSLLIKYFNKIAPLHVAIKNNNVELVKLLLSCPNIDVNNVYIYI